MADALITKEVIGFLEELKANNNREWFEARKPEFKKLQSQVKGFYDSLAGTLGKHDEIEKAKMFRIYRDVRFSPDKTPYKPHFAGSFARAGASRRGGYYLRIRPGESFAAVGFWQPDAKDLLRIRQELQQDAEPFRKVIGSTKLKEAWGGLKGECVKTAPKGFDREDPNIDLIRYKQFIFTREFTDKEVTEPGFLNAVDQNFQAIRPWLDLMSEILTTDLNGESLLG